MKSFENFAKYLKLFVQTGILSSRRKLSDAEMIALTLKFDFSSSTMRTRKDGDEDKDKRKDKDKDKGKDKDKDKRIDNDGRKARTNSGDSLAPCSRRTW